MANYRTFTEHADTVKIYVSQSDGSDGDNGLTPATAKATIAAGIALLRTGHPDWLLLKCGDTWTNENFGDWQKSGLDAANPMLVSSYGAGARPYVRTGTANGMTMFNAVVEFVAISGIRLHAHTRTGSEEAIGFFLLEDSNEIYFEDMFVEGFKDNFVIIAGVLGDISNITLNRCIIVNSFSTNADHSQGAFISLVDGLVIDECVFDLNGWNGVGADATVFNHNAYIDVCANVQIKNSLFMRASSIGNNLNSDEDKAAVFDNLLVENNFYIEGEIGISMGGDGAKAPRFTNVTIKDNVLMYIGRSQPTGRDLGWNLDMNDVDGDLVQGNLILYQEAAGTPNSFGIRFAGPSDKNLVVEDSIIFGVQTTGIIQDISGTETGIIIRNNDIQDPTEGSQMVDYSGSFAATTFSGNRYFTTIVAGQRFVVNGVNRSYAQWLTSSGETGSSNAEVTYPDPGRDEVSYMTSIGQAPATLAQFATLARANSKASWNTAYTAAAINDYVRAGFGLGPDPGPSAEAPLPRFCGD